MNTANLAPPGLATSWCVVASVATGKHVAQAWQAFYASPPHRVANLIMAAMIFLVLVAASSGPTRTKEKT